MRTVLQESLQCHEIILLLIFTKVLLNIYMKTVIDQETPGKKRQPYSNERNN